MIDMALPDVHPGRPTTSCTTEAKFGVRSSGPPSWAVHSGMEFQATDALVFGPGEACQNNSCAAVFFQPEFEGVVFPISQVHNLCSQSVCDADRIAIVIASGGTAVVAVDEVDQPLQSLPGSQAFFRKAEARRCLDFTGCGSDDGNIFLVVVNDEAILCLLISHIVKFFLSVSADTSIGFVVEFSAGS